LFGLLSGHRCSRVCGHVSGPVSAPNCSIGQNSEGKAAGRMAENAADCRLAGKAIHTSVGGHPYVVSGVAPATVFPWSGRPTDCLGGRVCRTAATYANPFNYGYLKPIDEPNGDSNGFWKGFWNRKRLRLRIR
jgi:hypothetical protein